MTQRFSQITHGAINNVLQGMLPPTPYRIKELLSGKQLAGHLDKVQ
jgi:hypothetical protein